MHRIVFFTQRFFLQQFVKLMSKLVLKCKFFHLNLETSSGGQISAIVKKKPGGFKGMGKTFGQKFRQVIIILYDKKVLSNMLFV